ncbi:MAG TPA: peptidylprolyl isomerase [Rubrobacteraceae bacterium]|nr:peptidylprolyl isomerase [Rubrobacteraceae bacterium]
MSKLLANRPWSILLPLVLALLVALGCQPAEPTANVESGAKKVAVFEGGEVTLGEVQEFAEQSGLGELSPDSPQYEAAISQIMPQLVDVEVTKAYAEEQGITVSDEEVEREIETIKDQLAEQAQAQGEDVGREEVFEQALEQAGITEAQLREQIREQLPVQRVQERVASDAEPSQQEVEAFYEENREAQFTTPEQRCARHILFTKDQREKAEDVKQQLENGADFAELAEENSQDPGSAEQGGDLGCLGRGETVPNFEDALFGAEQGEIVGPVETQFGFHVIEVTEINQESTEPLENVEGEIRDQLSADLQAEEFASWVEEQRQERNVKYLPGYEPPA